VHIEHLKKSQFFKTVQINQKCVCGGGEGENSKHVPSSSVSGACLCPLRLWSINRLWFDVGIIDACAYTGGPKKLAHCYVRLNFIKYWL